LGQLRSDGLAQYLLVIRQKMSESMAALDSWPLLKSL